MKKLVNAYSLLFIAACSVVACKSEKNKTDEMASAMCNCFTKLNDSIPAEAMGVFVKLSTVEKVSDSYTTEIGKLGPDVLEKLNRALMSTSTPGSPVKNCLEEMDKKYKTVGGQEGEMNRKMADALKGKAGCEMMVTLMRMQAEKLGK